MQLLKRFRLYIIFGVLVVGGPSFILMTNPEALPLPLLILPFLWLFSVLFLGCWLLLKLRNTMSDRQRMIICGVVATLPVLLVVLQSIHQLTIRDVLISLGLVLVGALYMSRADFINS